MTYTLKLDCNSYLTKKADAQWTIEIIFVQNRSFLMYKYFSKIILHNITSNLMLSLITYNRFTVSDWVPKKDSANFESDAFL